MRRLLLVATLVALAGCQPVSVPTNLGLVVVTAGGTAFVDGAMDIPPTLDLHISAAAHLQIADVDARLDGAPLTFHTNTTGVATTVSPLQLGSEHHLDLFVLGREGRHFDFHVVQPGGAMAAVHHSSEGTVLDVVFERAPDQAAVLHAVTSGAESWSDPTHLRVVWAENPPTTITLGHDISMDRGTHVADDLHISLALGNDSVRRVTVPAARSVGTPEVVAFSVETAASRDSLDTHAQKISVVSPTGWHIESDGTLSGTPDAITASDAQARGVPVWPLVQNDASDISGTSALVRDPARVATLSNSIVDGVTASDFGGIHLDVEDIPSEDRAAYSTLVHTVATALHAHGKKLAVDVVAHQAGHSTTASAGYDLAAINGDADVVVLMAYDEHYDGSSPGPVAGLDWDKSLLAGTLDQVTPAHTSLGVPLYSRTWSGGMVSSDGYDAAVSQLQQTGARVDYDFAAATPSVLSTDDSGVSVVTYFDDADSLARKIALSGDKKLAGIAMWRLGFEDPALWDLLPTQR